MDNSTKTRRPHEYRQIFVSQLPISKVNNQDYRRLVAFLKEKGYTLCHGLDDIRDDDRIVAVCVDVIEKEVWETNITCMAGWTATFKEHLPLSVDMFVEHFDALTIGKDEDLYDSLTRERYRKEKGGTLTKDEEFFKGFFRLSSYQQMNVILAVNNKRTIEEAGISDPREVEYYRRLWDSAETTETITGVWPVCDLPELEWDEMPNYYPDEFSKESLKCPIDEHATKK